MGNEEIIYGDSHGQTFDGATKDSRRHTHWDPKIEIRQFAHRVHIGIFPPDEEKSTDDGPIYDRDRAQFVTLNRDACNRLIKAVRRGRDKSFGKDE